MQRISETSQLLYSELLSLCIAEHYAFGRGITFVKKQKAQKNYWYVQVVVGASKRQHYLGVESQELLELIEKQKQYWKDPNRDTNQRERLVAMLIQGGVTGVTTTEARVFELLNDANLFQSGCILVGSHAYIAYANMLGIQWDNAAMRTQDIDVLNGLSLLTGKTLKSIDEIFSGSEFTLLEIPALNRRAPTTSYRLYKKELKIDLLTPMLGKPDSEPIHIKALNAYATPLRFLDYLQEDPVYALIVAKSGFLINVPNPARFAWHKLVVSQRRNAAFQLKARKDIKQAETLLEVLVEDRPGDIRLAYEAAEKMPAKFMSQMLEGFAKLKPDLKEKLKQYVR